MIGQLIKDIKEFLEWRRAKNATKPRRTRDNSSRITINGVSVAGDFSGGSVSIINGKIYVDGKDFTPDAKTISIDIHGNVESLDANSCYTVKIDGSVGSINGGATTIHCGDITGDAGDAGVGSGSIDCGNIQGNVTAGSGSIKVDSIKGNVKTGSGTIKYSGK